MAMMMRYLAVNSRDPQLPMTVAERELPEITNTQVLIKVSAFGVNRADLLQRAGHYPPPAGESDILGLEVCGCIVQTGKDVVGWQDGERVCGIVGGGGYAEYAAIESTHLIPLPDNLSENEGAGLAEVYLTAFQTLHTIAKLTPGQRALIHAGASGVGLAGIQLCKWWGVDTAVTASSPEKLSVCNAYGAKLLINYRQQDFVHELKTQWPDGVNAVLDVVAGEYVNRNLNVMAMDGVIVYLAILGGRFAERLDIASLLRKRITLTGSTLRNRSLQYKTELVSAFTQQCLPAFKTGALSVVIDSTYKADGIDQCHAAMQRNETMGKLVVTWD